MSSDGSGLWKASAQAKEADLKSVASRTPWFVSATLGHQRTPSAPQLASFPPEPPAAGTNAQLKGRLASPT
jgi:hypothetical protein